MSIIEKIRGLIGGELIKGSLILIILFNLGNVFSYLFQVSMARMLGPVDYGTLAFLTSILYIFSVPTMSIQTVVSKHTTGLLVKKELGKIKGFFFYMIKKTFLLASAIFVIFSIASLYLSKKLDIPFGLLILTGVFIFGAFVYPVATGVLQGMKKFGAWGWNSVSNSFIKLIVAILFVSIGFKVYGAMLGFLLGTIFSFMLIIPYLKRVIIVEKVEEKIKLFSKDTFATFMAMLFIVILYSSDVIFARMFFSSEIVGKYAVISMIGKIILFGATGIGNAMFPISSEKFESGDKTRGIIKKALTVTLMWCGGLVLSFVIFPEFVIKILFGGQYISLQNILMYIGIAFSFISLSNMFILYKISNNKFKLKHVIPLSVFIIVQIIFFYFGKNDIESFSRGFMFSTIITFIGSIILIRK